MNIKSISISRPRLLGLSLLTIALILSTSLTYSIVLNKAPFQISRGDFPAFFTAATIVASGNCFNVYSLDFQSKEQEKYFPERNNYFHAFAYPITLAVILSPLAHLGPTQAYWVCFLTMLISLVCAIRLIARTWQYQKNDWLMLLAYIILFPPTLISLFNGHISAFAFLCFAIIICCVQKLISYSSTVRRVFLESILGIAVGGLLLKPQFAIPLISFLIIRRQWRSLICFSVVSIFFYLLGVLWCNFNWPLTWISFAVDFGSLDQQVNGLYEISLPGVISQLIKILSFPTIKCLPLVISVLCQLAICCSLFSSRSKGDRDYLREQIVLLPVIAVLASPHSLFYDSLSFLFPVIYWSKATNKYYFLFLFELCAIMIGLCPWMLPINANFLLGLAVIVYHHKMAQNPRF